MSVEVTIDLVCDAEGCDRVHQIDEINDVPHGWAHHTFRDGDVHDLHLCPVHSDRTTAAIRHVRHLGDFTVDGSST